MKKKHIIVTIMLTGAVTCMTACASANEAVSDMAKVAEKVESGVASAAELAGDTIDRLGAISGLNGDYETLTDRLSAAAGNLKAQVIEGVDEYGATKYVEALSGKLEEFNNFYQKVKDSPQVVNVEDTTSAKFFKTTDLSTYKVSYAYYEPKVSENKVNFYNITGTPEGVHYNNYALNADSEELAKAVSLKYYLNTNSVWYECNSLTKSKAVVTEFSAMESGLDNWVSASEAYFYGNYVNSAINNIINDEDFSADTFELNGVYYTYVYKDGNLAYILSDAEGETRIFVIFEYTSGSNADTSIIDKAIAFTTE